MLLLREKKDDKNNANNYTSVKYRYTGDIMKAVKKIFSLDDGDDIKS